VSDRSKGLTPKQQRFVQEYLVDLNATQAAIRAGYSVKSAQEQGSRLLSNVMVSEAIAAAQVQRARRCQIDSDRVLRELAALAFSDLGELLEFDGTEYRFRKDVGESSRRAVSSVKLRREAGKDGKPAADIVEFRLWSKTDALRLLAQHLGMLKEVHELTGANGGPIQHRHDLTKLSDEQLEQLDTLLEAAGRQTG
jgi:phage terminase small subunit